MSLAYFKIQRQQDLLDVAESVLLDSESWMDGYKSLNNRYSEPLENKYTFSEESTEAYQKWVDKTECLKGTLVACCNQICIFRGMDRDDGYYYYRLYDPILGEEVVMDTMFGIVSLKEGMLPEAYLALVHNFNFFSDDKIPVPEENQGLTCKTKKINNV